MFRKHAMLSSSGKGGPNLEDLSDRGCASESYTTVIALCRRAPVSDDSVSAVYRDPKKI
jgi:hypothetical protein